MAYGIWHMYCVLRAAYACVAGQTKPPQKKPESRGQRRVGLGRLALAFVVWGYAVYSAIDYRYIAGEGEGEPLSALRSSPSQWPMALYAAHVYKAAAKSELPCPLCAAMWLQCERSATAALPALLRARRICHVHTAIATSRSHRAQHQSSCSN
jgi:hypothetical protein